MKIRFLATVLASALCAAFAPPPAVRPVESVPKEIGGLKFSVISQAEWGAGFPGLDGKPAILQLRIENASPAAMLFPTFDTIFPVITGPDGEKARLGGGRDGTIITPSILLQAGQVFSYPLDAKLAILKDKEGSHLTIQIQDGTGTWFTAGVAPGKYKIAIQLRSVDPDVVKNSGHEAPMWAATGETDTAEFTILPVSKPAK